MLRPSTRSSPYLHLAPNPELTRGLQETGATCVAYETVEDSQGRLPLLAPMSEVAGKIATQAGAFFLEKPLGGRDPARGRPGVAPANVMVIGGGAVGMNAAFIAIGMEADVFVFDVSIDKLVSSTSPSAATPRPSSPRPWRSRRCCRGRTGDRRRPRPWAKAPFVVRREQLKLMKKNAVLVDVAIDQGGCFETSHPTTHRDPSSRSMGSPTTASRTCPARSHHIDLCPTNATLPVCPGPGGPWHRGGGPPRSRPETGDQRHWRYCHSSRRRGSRRGGPHTGRGRARQQTESLTKEERWQPQQRRSRRRMRLRSST